MGTSTYNDRRYNIFVPQLGSLAQLSLRLDNLWQGDRYRCTSSTASHQLYVGLGTWPTPTAWKENRRPSQVTFRWVEWSSQEEVQTCPGCLQLKHSRLSAEHCSAKCPMAPPKIQIHISVIITKKRALMSVS